MAELQISFLKRARFSRILGTTEPWCPLDDRERLGMIFAWLKGYIVTDETGLSAEHFLEGQNDGSARKLLADAIRSRQPLEQSILDALANLIDPTSSTTHEPDRMLVFKFRSRGKRANRIRKGEIFSFIRKFVEAGTQVESAVAEAMAKFNLSRAEVYKIWTLSKEVHDEAIRQSEEKAPK